jgi:hypothetical protein
MISQLIDGEWRQISDEEHVAQLVAQAHADGWDPCLRCFSALIDGVCGYCRAQDMFNADPDYRAWSDAQQRLDFGGWAPESTRPYMHEDAQADEALVKKLSAKFNAAERNATMDPGGCALCGLPERGHKRWHGPGWQGHGAPSRGFVPPSDELRKARMAARRNMRNGRPAWAALDLGGAA